MRAHSPYIKKRRKRKAVNKSITSPGHAHMYSDLTESSVLVDWSKQVTLHMSDGAQLTSLGIEFHTQEDAKEN